MKEIRGFKNSWILLEDGFVKTDILIEDGLIKKIGNIDNNNLICLDEDKIILPGFIDQHTHGANGSDIMDGTIESITNIANSLLQEGTTSFLPTTSTHSKENLIKALNTINQYIKYYNNGSTVLGIHLEGPYISKEYAGAQLTDHIIEASIESFDELNNASGNNIKIVSLDIQNSKTYDFIKYLSNNNIVPSIGHANSSYDEVIKSVSYGLKGSTHTYNAQKKLHHRDIGTVGSVLLCDDIYTEIICDRIHVCEEAIKLLYKNKPKDKIILITDSLRCKYLPDGIYQDLEQTFYVSNSQARLADGTLAGSVLKMNEAVKNIQEILNISLEEAIKFATINPATLLGVDDKIGSIKVGKIANLLVTDKNLNIYQTIVSGQCRYNK